MHLIVYLIQYEFSLSRCNSIAQLCDLVLWEPQNLINVEVTISDKYLEGLMGQMNPYPAPHSVLVINNCQIHHVFGVEELCEAQWVISPSPPQFHSNARLSSGIKLIYLPPYPPDYNPIEECFSYIKAYIRRHGYLFWDIVESGDKAAPFYFLYGALDKVTAAASCGWFHNSGYI